MGCGPDKQKASASETALAGIAREQYDYYKRVGVPLENNELEDIQALDTEERRGVSIQRAKAAAREAMPSTRDVARAVNPNGMRFKQAIVDVSADRGEGLARAGAAGSAAHSDRVVQRKTRALRLGRGIASDATRGMQSSASFEAGVASANTSMRTAWQNQLWGAVGEAAGAGIGYGYQQGWGFGGGKSAIAKGGSAKSLKTAKNF